MSSDSQDILRSFDHLPPSEKREVASEIFRREFVLDRSISIDEGQLSALYSEFAGEDIMLAEEGIEDYRKGLLGEDVR